jgi:F-type H+-transporting ATPase subunit epsilon
MKLVVVTPSRKVLETECEEVYLPGEAGEFGVLPEHSGLVSELSIGPMRYRENGRHVYMAIRGGFAQVMNDHIVVLADEVKRVDEIQSQELATQLESMNEKLLNPPEGEDHEDLLKRVAWIKTWEETTLLTKKQ